jgi:glycosyltransferase involved in cell wall biosynthesis
MGFFSRVFAFLYFAISASWKGVRVGGDLVFATSTPLTICIPAIFVSKIKRIPMVFEVRDLWPEIPIALGAIKNPILKKCAFFMEKCAYRNSKAIVALSPGMRDGVVSAGVCADKVSVIPNSSDNTLFFNDELAPKIVDFRERSEWLKGAPLVLYAGTFGFVNGVGYMVRLASEVLKAKSDVKFLLVGEGREFDGVKSLASELGVLGVNVFIEESVPKSEMPVVFGAATMTSSLVIDRPELTANSANKFFDSLAAGKPILLNHGGWMADLIEAKSCGLVLWGLSPKKAAEILIEKISDPAWVEEAGRNAKELALLQFDRDSLAEQFESVLKYAVEEYDVVPRDITSRFYG